MSNTQIASAMNKTPMPQTVAIIIVNYNGGERLERCLRSLSRQTRIPDRIVLVDNNSDNFSAIQTQTDFPQIEIVSLQENVGFAAANNLAVKKLDDVEWIALLNPDAYAEPGWLENLMYAVEEHPEFSFFGSRMLAMKENILDGTGDVYHVSGACWRRDHGKSADRRKQSDEIISPSGAAALYRRDIYLEAEGMNEDFFCYMEDIDLGIKLQSLGYRCLYISNAVVIHEGSALVGQYSDFQVYHGHRNMVWVYVMNMPGPWLWIYLPQHILYNIATILLFIFRGQARVILQAKIDAIKGLARAWKQRRTIKANARVSAEILCSRIKHGVLAPYLNRNE